MNRLTPRRRKVYRHNQTHKDPCWRLKQKYDRYRRTGAPIGACQEEGQPDNTCLIFGSPTYRVGALGKNRACMSCGRYWIS